ncbi:MAG: hypothetical protein RPR91_04280 [Colwellia sp.]
MNIEGLVAILSEGGGDCLLLCDHDVYRLTKAEESVFSSNDIVLLRAIEFTTKEGVHLIGVHSNIVDLERPAYHYCLQDLLKLLKSISAAILFPHPSHKTGVMGNENLQGNEKISALMFADFIELNNYRYGRTFPEDVKWISTNVANFSWLIGSDAHKVSEVTAFYNTTEKVILSESDFKMQAGLNFNHKINKKRGGWYFRYKKFQKTALYQNVTNILSPKFRRVIKNYLGMS